MLHSVEIYLGRDPDDAIWLATMYAINVHPDRLPIMIASLDPGRDALEATDLGTYLAGITDLVDEWEDLHGPGRDPASMGPGLVLPSYSLTYAAGRTWLRRHSGSWARRHADTWQQATTDPAGPPETRENFNRVLDGFAGVPGDPCEVLLREEACR
ncbi:hypothetical protein [Amycolatopsis nigrescens]|uniref:hypothetical protein n=1 Tax=Amycolatopsis nigrescens TaxID=381445 RepID=UPI00037BDE81|nr:hypothetical protein [Amycolatopsis nigrescens]